MFHIPARTHARNTSALLISYPVPVLTLNYSRTYANRRVLVSPFFRIVCLLPPCISRTPQMQLLCSLNIPSELRSQRSVAICRFLFAVEKGGSRSPYPASTSTLQFYLPRMHKRIHTPLRSRSVAIPTYNPCIYDLCSSDPRSLPHCLAPKSTPLCFLNFPCDR